MTREEIKEELQKVKYYYENKKALERLFKNTDFLKELERLAKKYDELVEQAPTDSLKKVYERFYHFSVTWQACADGLFYSLRHIERLHSELIKYFITKLQGVQPT